MVKLLQILQGSEKRPSVRLLSEQRPGIAERLLRFTLKGTGTGIRIMHKEWYIPSKRLF
jgi:hypothetical protein